MKKIVTALCFLFLTGLVYAIITMTNPPTPAVETSEGTPVELTISAGEITRTQIYHTVDTENDDPADDLDTINGGSDGKRIILTTVNSNRDVTIKHGTGNISLEQNNDFVLDNVNATIELIYNGTKWLQVNRNANT